MRPRPLIPKRRPHAEPQFAHSADTLPCAPEAQPAFIAQCKLAEEALKRSEEQYRLLFESNPIPMWVFDRGTLRFLAVNDAAIRQYGYTEREFMAMTIADIRPADDIPALFADVGKQGYGLQEPGPWRHRRKNGSLIDVEIVGHSIAYHGAEAVLIAAHDITERNRSRETLQDSESKYRVLFEESADAFWLMDEKGFVDCNSAALKMFGFRDKAEFKSPAEISPPNQADGTPSAIAAAKRISAALLGGKENFEWLHQRKNGEVFHAEVSLATLTLTGRRMLMATVRDITERKWAEESLSFNAALLKAESESAIDGILAVDESARIILANKQFGKHFDIPEEMLTSGDDRMVRRYVTERVEDAKAFVERVTYLYDHPEEKSTDEVRLKSGKTFERYSAPLLDANGRHRGRVWYFHDVTERKEIEAALRQAEQKYRAIFENAVVGIFRATVEGRPVSVNRAMARMHGYGSPEELLEVISNAGQQVFVDPARMPELHRAAANGGSVRNAEVEIYCKDRSRKWILVNLQAESDDSGKIIFINGTSEDITARKRAEERVQFLAYFDALTGLPNRLLMSDRLATALTAARRRNETIAVLCLDLDRFKQINDSLGHAMGDLVLKAVAERIKGCTREEDTVSRIGGDNFVIVLSGVDDASVVASRIVHALTATFEVKGHSLNTSCSIGISMFPEHSDDGETLVKFADQAMYCAKESGRNGFRLFNAEMNVRIRERATQESDLRRALEREEFFLVYQPQIVIANGELAGLEGLIRWRHPQLGLVPPDRFIGLAEDTGLILPIGEWVLRAACSQAQKWVTQGLLKVPVAVNVSAVQFRQAEFSKLIERVLRETGLSPQYLELELTESLLLSNQDVVLSVLRELKEMGVRLAIDDFGTGYSSLSYLKRFCVNKLKIDRSFIHEVTTNANDAAITTAIIHMAKSLNLTVIAEGVENESQLAFLRAHQCDEMQGYYISKPETANDVVDRFLCGPRGKIDDGSGSSERR
ncbi:MAG: EAL domain-containing protein [Terracidiphilus sp.]